MASIDRIWEDEARKYQPRVAVLCRMTDLDPGNQRLVDLDLEHITEILDDVSSTRPAPWDHYFAHEIVPARHELDEATAHSNEELAEVNISAMGCSDAVLIHGSNDGSTMLGHLQAHFLMGSLPRPVGVIHHSAQPLSKAWRGLAGRYPFLSFENEFDLCTAMTDWLTQWTTAIEAGPARRRARDLAWETRAASLYRRWSTLDTDEQKALAASVGLAAWALGDTLRHPGAIAELPVNSVMLLLQALLPDIERDDLVSRAHEAFDPGELRAWGHWGRDKSEAYRYAVLARALDVRLASLDGIHRSPGYLGQPGLWNGIAAEWRHE